MRVTRRQLLGLGGGLLAVPTVMGGYAVGVEPIQTPRLVSHRVATPAWRGPPLRIAVLADIHACEPWMTERRIEGIVDACNRLNADVIVLLGDFVVGRLYVTGEVPADAWAAALSRLDAPLGVHAILGNHDWWSDEQAQRLGHGPVFARVALEKAGIPVMENDVVRLSVGGASFWLAGLADQIALLHEGQPGRRMTGLDDLPGTLARADDDAPVILLAHEPDIFVNVPPRVALTLSGHTHGGQVRILGYSPVVPSKFGNRFAYGHVVEDGRHLIVSGGLGCSIAPVRFGMPPEINLVELASVSA